MATNPPIPSGWKIEEPATAPRVPKIPDGFVLETNGEVVDGDTVRLDDGRNGRLSGVDAYESDQLGYLPDGSLVPLGQQATSALDDLVTAQTNLRGIGAETFGRPVVVARTDGKDVAIPLLLSGRALAAPEYLGDDPQRRAAYMESERLGRLNLQGGHGAQTISPRAHRLADRWNLKLRPDEEVQFNSDLPDFRPDFKRLTNEQEQEFYGFLASKAGDKNFSQADLDAYWKAKGYQGSTPADEKFIESIRNGEKYGPLDYSSWDAQTLRDFKMENAFAGMRPEIREEYNSLLQSATSPEAIQKWGEQYGMTFDPRDLRAFVEAKAQGGNPNIPIPIINPGDGAGGAAGRGFIDTLGIAGEVGGLVDTVAPQWMQEAAQSVSGGSEGFKHRETIYNSDRPFLDIVNNNWRQNESILDYDETRHPYARLGGQIVGGIFIPGSAGVRGASGFAKAGAIEGGIYGFGSGDGSLGTRLANVPLNAAAGGVGGAVIGKGIDLVRGLTKRFASALRLRGGSSSSEIAADGERIAAFEQSLSEQVGPDASEITDEQLQRAFAAADNAASGSPVSRADMAAEPDSSLTGPRIADTIDVNATRARPMGDGPSPDLMQAATARMDPQDVLPRPRNELTPEEAARLGEGPYKPVEAPRERDYLQAAEYPSRANPDETITRKGPADLVTFTRSLNGIRDEGGELTAAGISNAVRKGEDFAGGENRLGKLVNPEGMGLEEAADRAWREGYFPELDRPPTNAEFVAALDDTYRGVARRFLPEDEGQIQAFEGARDQRLAVERSRQDGAPLADDLGQPTTYDDMVANTPPPMNPDEWDAATLARVGNVRVDNLNTPQEISRALKTAHDIAGGFDSARRGVITQAETEALASDLGMTAEQLLSRRKGQAFNAEEALAARRILAASGNDLVNMARRIQRSENPGDEALAHFHRAMIRHTAIQEQVAGMTAEAGRTLQQFRQIADGRRVNGKVLEGFVNGAGGPQRLKEAAEAIIDLERDPANLNRFIEKASKPRFRDKAVELWYNFLLSGPQTHAVNVLSNTLTSIAQIPEHGVAAAIGKGRRIFKGPEIDRVTFSEVGARAAGLLQGTKEGMQEFARAFRTGEPSDFVSKVEGQSQKAISGLKGEVIRVPTRLLTAEDELFKAIARRQALAGLAVRRAGQKGLKGEEAKRYASDLVNNPPDALMEEAMDYARYVTFQNKLGPVGSKISSITNDMPILKAVLPFIRTPTNLIKFTVERSPAAPLLREWRKDFAAGGARRDIAVARATVGTGVAALVAELAAQGKITGSPPSDENKRRLLMADGWQPYSVKIGDRYFSYRRLDPFAMTFGTAADIATLGEGMSGKQREEGVGLVVGSIISNLTNKTWLSGLTDALEAIRDPERYSGSFIERLTGSATVPTGFAQVARTIDPTMRETDGVGDAIRSRVPGLSDDLLPKRDIWGRPIKGEGGIGPDIVSPIWTSTAKNDPITLEVLRAGGVVSVPQKGDLTPQQYDKLLETRGPIARRWLGELFGTPEYRAMSADDQAEEIRKTMAKATKAAKANIFGGEPVPDSRPESYKKGEPRFSSKVQPIIKGNLPLGIRDRVQNVDGSISTVRTMSIATDDGEVLIPTVIGGRVVTDVEAIRHYERTGENFGTFATPADATAYAETLHRYHERLLDRSGAQSAPAIPSGWELAE